MGHFTIFGEKCDNYCVKGGHKWNAIPCETEMAFICEKLENDVSSGQSKRALFTKPPTNKVQKITIKNTTLGHFKERNTQGKYSQVHFSSSISLSNSILCFKIITSYAEVSCGGHNAASCDLCPLPTMSAVSSCNGDCKWNSDNNECYHKAGLFYLYLVNHVSG